jgi:hypothetical protein
MARILVGLKVRKGLTELMDIRRGVDLFRLNMNYEGIPFICVHFITMGTLLHNVIIQVCRRIGLQGSIREVHRHWKLETIYTTSRKKDVWVQVT